LDRLVGGWRRLGDYDHTSIPIASSVHAPKPLHHALPGHEVRNHVIGIEIHADFACRRRDDERGARRPDIASREEAALRQPLLCLLPLEYASPADEQLRFDLNAGSALLLVAFG